MTEEQNQTTETQEQANEDRGERFVWKGDDVEIALPSEKETEVEMEQVEDEPKKAIHHATRRGADMSLSKRDISQESHAAVLAGRITLQDARDLGRNAGPDGPVGQSTKKASKKDRTPTETPCLCGCGELTVRRFRPGHDMRMFQVAREHLTEGREITDAQREYLETSGKMQRVKDKLAADEVKRQEKIAAKTEAQRKREGEAEAKKRNTAD